MSVSEADDLFLRLAAVKAAIDKKSAAHKKRIADLEAAHKEQIQAELAEKEALEKELGVSISVSPINQLGGAFGAAIYGWKKIS